MSHPLAAVLERAAAGAFPPADGQTEVLPSDADGTVAVVAFTGHAYVLADVDCAEVARHQTDTAGGGFGGALAPAVQAWLAGPSGTIGSIDVVLARRGTGGGTHGLSRHDLGTDHPRVRRATSHRRGVEVFGDSDGLVIVGKGLVDRWELSVERFAAAATTATTTMTTTTSGGGGAGAGRRLISSALGRIPATEWCWAQVASGNARSLRAFLACGFVPVCSEVLIDPGAWTGTS